MTMTAVRIAPDTFDIITKQLPDLTLPSLRRTYEFALENNENAMLIVSDDPAKDKTSTAVGVTPDVLLDRYCDYDHTLINHHFTEIVYK